jgi:hypothetical protein
MEADRDGGGDRNDNGGVNSQASAKRRLRLLLWPETLALALHKLEERLGAADYDAANLKDANNRAACQNLEHLKHLLELLLRGLRRDLFAMERRLKSMEQRLA